MGHPDDFPLAAKPTRARFGVLAFVCSLSVITYLDRVCIMRASEDVQADLGLTARQMGLVFSAFLLGYTLFEVPGGWMGDRWGSRRVLARIVLCWSLFTALTGFVWSFSFDSGRALGWGGWQIPLVFDSLGLLLLIRFLFGAGEAGAYPNITRVIRDWFPIGERAFAQGWVWMCARLGGAVAPVVIGRLTVAIGWRQAFWVLGLVGVGWAVCFLRWFRSSPAKHPRCNPAELHLIHDGQPAAVHAAGHAWPGFSALVGSLSVWAMGSAAFWVCFGWYFYPTWQPKYLKDVHGFQVGGWRSEVLTGLPFLCGAVGCMLGGGISGRLVQRLGHRWGRSSIGLVGFAGAGACVLATGFATSAWQAVTLLCLAFLVNDLAVPVLWASAADVGGRFAGTVAGVMNMIGGIGAVLSPVLIPYVLAWLPEGYSADQRWRIIFAGLAGAWFLASASWLFVDAGKRLPQGSSSVPTPTPGGDGATEPVSSSEGVQKATDALRSS
jgi:MFS family permease